MKYVTAIRRFFREYWESLPPFSRAAFVRAVKTMAQVAVSYMATSSHLSGVNWGDLIDLVGMSGLMSLLTSASTGLPEVPKAPALEAGGVETEEPETEGGDDDGNNS